MSLSVVTYALCKKLISESATGIKSITVDEYGDLVFTLGDGTIITVDMPIKVDAIDIKYINDFPISGISPTTIYCKKTNLVDDEGNDIYTQWMYVNNSWRLIGKSGAPIASTEHAGLVKLDGVSLITNDDGETEVSTDFIEDQIGSQIGNISNSDVDDLFD